MLVFGLIYFNKENPRRLLRFKRLRNMENMYKNDIMKNIVTQFKINVFSYPEHSKRRSSTIKILESLIGILNSKYMIPLSAKVEDAHISYPHFSRFLIIIPA